MQSAYGAKHNEPEQPSVRIHFNPEIPTLGSIMYICTVYNRRQPSSQVLTCGATRNPTLFDPALDRFLKSDPAVMRTSVLPISTSINSWKSESDPQEIDPQRSSS
ncbi:hypothetical protein O6H91_Y139600 [Diphasiastrum complanatum]|nr:hypothetical protein O6H91_Y139600 [Diphasiastrum complanatum]